MSNLEKIEEYNSGTVYPENYDLTYLATKHIQEYALIVENDIVDKIKQKLVDNGLFFDDPNLPNQLATALIKGNIILQGPPGTGKTTLAAILADCFNCDCDIVTAVSDWTTYDTIGGLQPSVDDDGNEIISGKNGRVVESIISCCNTVVKNVHYSGKKQAKWLIIDELNRSEIDKVFGDLFTAFGASDSKKRKIPLWFESDENKLELFIPQRFRIIGVMNNYDKNYVFDLSHGLARRFTIININPPHQSSFDNEVSNCKNIVKKSINKKIPSYCGTVIDETVIDSIFNDTYFKDSEVKMLKFIKHIRYELDNTYLGLLIGTAQILDLYETIVLSLLLSSFLGLPSTERTESAKNIIDESIASRIVPQIDGCDYLKIKDFYDFVEKEEDFGFLIKTKETLKLLF